MIDAFPAHDTLRVNFPARRPGADLDPTVPLFRQGHGSCCMTRRLQGLARFVADYRDAISSIVEGRPIAGIAVVRLSEGDIVRHSLVAEMLTVL